MIDAAIPPAGYSLANHVAANTKGCCRTPPDLPIVVPNFPDALGPLVLLVDPTIAFLATNKIIGNLLGRFPAWNLDPVPLSILVIDEDMRTRTLDPWIP